MTDRALVNRLVFAISAGFMSVAWTLASIFADAHVPFYVVGLPAIVAVAAYAFDLRRAANATADEYEYVDDGQEVSS